jgi:hypothetical protein
VDPPGAGRESWWVVLLQPQAEHRFAGSVGRCGMTGSADQWVRRTTIGCVGMLALIAGTVSYLHKHLLVELHGQPGGGSADAAVGGRDDRGGFDYAAGRGPDRRPRRHALGTGRPAGLADLAPVRDRTDSPQGRDHAQCLVTGLADGPQDLKDIEVQHFRRVIRKLHDSHTAKRSNAFTREPAARFRG